MLPVEHTIVPHAIHDQQLVAFDPDAVVREVVDAMAKRRFGAVPVVEDGKLVGIFTERDVLVRVVAARKDPETTRLAEVMTANPDTVKSSDAVLHALELMNQHGYRHLPVVDGGRLIGVVSIRDLYRSVKEQMDSDILLLAETLIQG
ncbi:MAG TPA: CBS domain-containing protein [Alphaproteobacteria bacterium]|nr:CBS domain-containing protein [Alphaproteobacteria bacterium]